MQARIFILLSGSRGVGGSTSLTSSRGITQLELLDMEEDEVEKEEVYRVSAAPTCTCSLIVS